ncbi:MAG: flagellar hook-basal body complex protein FliE [Planctomycetes bacterium]|jgi:flagellar hook-basal body complex protein FliE|nr:flagellar hook-basal body complex protein FliE [Planctomycetota bacterium]
MINFNSNVSSVLPKGGANGIGAANGKSTNPTSGFSDTVKAAEKYLSKVDDYQQSSDLSIQDLLSGKNNDIASTVSAVAKADMSFKLLVGVRNKLIEAYKQTMNMPL